MNMKEMQELRAKLLEEKRQANVKSFIEAQAKERQWQKDNAQVHADEIIAKLKGYVEDDPDRDEYRISVEGQCSDGSFNFHAVDTLQEMGYKVRVTQDRRFEGYEDNYLVIFDL